MSMQTTVTIRPETRLRLTYDGLTRPDEVCGVYVNTGEAELLLWAPNYDAAVVLRDALEACREAE